MPSQIVIIEQTYKWYQKQNIEICGRLVM